MAERPQTTEPKSGGNTPAGHVTLTTPENIDALTKRAEAGEAERDNYLGMLQRCRAEFENYQKRFKRELEAERQYASAGLARDILPVLDSLERALATQPPGPMNPLTEGVVLVRVQLLDVLRRSGVTAFEPLGEMFDPTVHEAVRQQHKPEVPPGTIIEVVEPGYRMHDRILRPAKVVIATATGH